MPYISASLLRLLPPPLLLLPKLFLLKYTGAPIIYPCSGHYSLLRIVFPVPWQERRIPYIIPLSSYTNTHTHTHRYNTTTSPTAPNLACATGTDSQHKTINRTTTTYTPCIIATFSGCAAALPPAQSGNQAAPAVTVSATVAAQRQGRHPHHSSSSNSSSTSQSGASTSTTTASRCRGPLAPYPHPHHRPHHHHSIARKTVVMARAVST